MAIQYFMRAFNTSLVKYVDWVVNDAPDSTGQFSGYSPGSLINIVVNRVVTSKVDNFLKPNQSLGGTDGNFFHVNSYDWRNAVAPILPPSNLTGIAVERGISAVQGITGATNNSPIEITTSSPHLLSSGALVTIIGVLGNVGANGTWPIIVTGGTTFTLTGSTGTGAYTSGGTAYVPTSMSVLAWDEINQIWRFFFNTNGDGTTIGASQDVSVNNFLVGGYIAIGPDPADTGAIRLSNDQYIFSESNPSGTDIQLIGADTINRIKLGSLATDIVYDPGVFIVDGYIQHDGTGSNTAQTTGFIREQNNTNIIAFRGAGALAGSDIVALGSNSNNNIVYGDSVNTGMLYNTSTGSIHQFQVNTNPVFEHGSNFARFTNNALVTAPTILQTASTTGSGQTLTLQAQDAAAGANTGGILTLKSGTRGAGGNAHGTVDIVTGTDGSNPPKIRVFPTQNSGTSSNSILYGANLFRVDTAQVNPLFRQDDQVTTGNGNSYNIQAQNAQLGSPSSGGNVNLITGKGSDGTGLKDGYLFVQTGTNNVTQIVVSPVNFPAMQYPTTTGKVVITGNFEVQGATTTVDSTIVDIVGQVIHANWSDPSISPNVGIPSTNTGYSIHRGNAAGVPRDGAAWIWREPGDLVNGADGYWRAVTIPGDGAGADQNFTIANSTNALGVMGLDFSASSDPNPVNGYLAASGSLRSTNNVPAVVSRNITLTTTLTATGLTNGSAPLPLATITVVSTTGFSSSGTLLIQSSAGPQVVTYTGITATSFTGAAGGSGTIVTDGIVAQTNQTTTIAVGSNGVPLPAGTINVASTTGFPASGVLRIVSNVTAGSGTAFSVQNVNYTSINATQFLGCTGGTGTLFTGGSVTSLPGGLTTLTQAFGTADNVLLGTDFGNRILHGSPSNNTGHIFNTPTGFFYDFQINSVSQVQLRGDVDTDSFIKTITIAPTVNTPKIYQVVQPNTGTNNGFNLKLQAQAGQQQTGATTNNNGGSLILASGAAGTGGSGAAGIHGTVDILTDAQLKVRIFPTDAAPVGSSVDDNSILYFESLFRVDTAQIGIGPLAGTGIRFRQDDTVGATGQVYTIQAQNAATTGGNLVLTSGFGSSADNAGQVKLSTGSGAITSIDRVIVYPTGAPVLPQGLSGAGISYTEFRDTAQGVFINPVSAGIASLGFASTVTGAQIAQVATASTPSAPMTIQSQVTTAASGVGGNLGLIAGNATGATSTGGNLNLSSGSGTATNGVVNILIGGTQAIAFNNVDSDVSGFAEVMAIAATIPHPRIYQVATGNASGNILALMAQNALTTGGPLQLHSGTGATNDGYINLTTGNTVKMTIFPTTAVSAADNNSILIFENKFRFDTAQLTPLIRQDDTAGATGQVFTVQSQNALTTGGNLVLTSGTGATVAGNTQLQTGGVDRVVVHPTFTEFRDTAEALRITPVSAGTTQITFAATDTAAQINQTVTAATPSAPMTVQSQVTNAASGQGGNLILIAGNATGTTSTGGNAILTSGTGTTVAGNTQLQTGGVDRVVVHPTFTEFRDTAEAFRITPVSAGTTQLTFAATDTAAQINQTQTASTPSAPMTVQSQVTTASSGVGGTLSLIAGNATGTTSTGGALNLASGSGTSTNGVINFQPGGTTQILITATGSQIQWVDTVTAPTLKQNDNTTASATGQALTVQAQNATGATSTGGNAVVTSGTGTTVAGNVSLQTGAVDRVVVHPTFTEFRDTAEALRVTPVSTGTTSVQFASTALASRIFQADLTANGGSGAALTIQAQNETGAVSFGGNLNLTSGTGTSIDGYTNLQAGGSTVARVHTDKFMFSKGWRRNVSQISSSGTYGVLAMEDYIAVTSLTAAFQINLPASPMVGDTYEIKDATGNATTFNITVSGNGNNIDGAGTFVLTQAYASAAFTYTGTQWSVT